MYFINLFLKETFGSGLFSNLSIRWQDGGIFLYVAAGIDLELVVFYRYGNHDQ